MRVARLVLGLSLAIVVVSLTPRGARAEGRQGDIVQTDTLGLPIVTHKFDTGETTTIGEEQNLSEFVGLHYFFIDRLRVGMNLQFTEQLAPALTPTGGSALRTFALLPQIGWDLWVRCSRPSC